MLQEGYLEFFLRWNLYRRWHPRPKRQAEYNFHRMMKSLPRGGLFIDLGANVGDVTRHALAYGMKVIAFEPDPVARQILTTRFGKDERVTIIPKAVGGWARKAVLHQARTDSNIRMSEWSSLFAHHKNGTNVEVEVVDLVQFLRDLNEAVAIIKMDIEGAEAECIEAILDAKIAGSIGRILVETHERISPELSYRIGCLRNRLKDEGIRNIDLDWA